MQIWLDTINLKTVEDGVKIGIIAGITTNPTILSQTKHVRDTLLQLLTLQKGPVAVQVTSQDTQSMVEEGKTIAAISQRMIVKVPVTPEGLTAMRQLIEYKIPVLGTTIIHPSQALLAATLKANYIAPYLSQMSYEDFKTIVLLLKANHYPTKLLAASIKTVEEIIALSHLGIDAITIKEDLYSKLVAKLDLVDKYISKFSSDWQQTHGSATIKDLLINPDKNGRNYAS